MFQWKISFVLMLLTFSFSVARGQVKQCKPPKQYYDNECLHPDVIKARKSTKAAKRKAARERVARENAQFRSRFEDLGNSWVRITGGTFQMGGGDHAAYANEGPVHSVSVATFEIAATEVTVNQYLKCYEAKVCKEPRSDPGCNWNIPGREDHPINCVDWEQANAYSKWVGGRLPTEAEWEYAARNGGKNQKYPWGQEKATCKHAVMNGTDKACAKNGTSPVCSMTLGITADGLCDMAGNVYEWVSDWYGAYSSGSTVNLEGPLTGTSRVIRGGSWKHGARNVRTAHRYFDPGRLVPDIGFRPARSVR